MEKRESEKKENEKDELILFVVNASGRRLCLSSSYHLSVPVFRHGPYGLLWTRVSSTSPSLSSAVPCLVNLSFASLTLLGGLAQI